MLVIGIDASTVNIGYAVMIFETETIVTSGVIPLGNKDGYYVRLKKGPRKLKEALIGTGIITPDNLEAIVIEHSFFTNNPYTGKQISMMIGGCLCILLPWCMNIKELAPTEIKKVFTGKAKAEKSEVIEAVWKRFSVEGIGEDEADAIAIAAAYIDMQKSGAFKEKAKEKAEKLKKRREKSAKTRAAKTKKALPGELKL